MANPWGLHSAQKKTLNERNLLKSVPITIEKVDFTGGKKMFEQDEQQQQQMMQQQMMMGGQQMPQQNPLMGPMPDPSFDPYYIEQVREEIEMAHEEFTRLLQGRPRLYSRFRR